MPFSIADFTLLDWLVAAILAYSVVMSTLRGFVREILGLVTVVAGLILAAWFHDDLAVLFMDVVATDDLALFVAFSLLFAGTLAVGFTLIWVTYRVFRIAHIEWFDRVLGGAFGFVRGWLIAAAIFVGFTSFGIRADAVRNSELSPYFLAGSRAIVAMTPFELKARFMVGYEEVQRWWSENL
jgi:membrane protein required for colicin V production